MIHQVIVKVDEEGTEAAAVTVITGETKSNHRNNEETILFNANKTFQYSIINVKHKFVLFDGIYNGE
jgi:serine protease inhibitor